MNKKLTLGLAMIVRDCEKSLTKCLSSCHDLFDEIVIVDTGSIDKTKSIALQFTNKVYDFKWINDFSAARNFSFSLMTTDFIMWLDDDDEILPEDCQKIKSINFGNKEIIICIYHYSHDKFGSPDCILERERIVKRSLNLKWKKPIHEHLPLNNCKISREDIVVRHNKKSVNLERNLEILEKIIKTDKEPRNFYYLGRELTRVGRIEEALINLEIFVKTNGWYEDIFSAYYIIAKNYLLLKQEEKFFENIYKSINIEPRRSEPYYELGSYSFSKKQWNKAIFWFELCLNIKRPKELMSTYFSQYYTWKPALSLCLCYNKIGNLQKAHEYNELFLKFRPSDSRGHHNRSILKNSYLREGLGKKLNLGCGNKRIEGYINADIVNIPEVDEVFNMKEIPYKDNSISEISTEHSLEHLSFEDSRQAIKEIFRVLEPGGILKLFIPDLEFCCKGYLEGDNHRRINGFPEKEWYSKCLYGIQRHENGSDAKHQFHLSGYSMNEIKKELEQQGFIIDYCERY